MRFISHVALMPDSDVGDRRRSAPISDMSDFRLYALANTVLTFYGCKIDQIDRSIDTFLVMLQCRSRCAVARRAV